MSDYPPRAQNHDLEAAEHHIEYLRGLVQLIRDHGTASSAWDRLFDACRKPWCRPSCENGLCYWDCRCLAHPDGSHHHLDWQGAS